MNALKARPRRIENGAAPKVVVVEGTGSTGRRAAGDPENVES